MEKDFNQKKEKCYDDVINSTISTEQTQDVLDLDKFLQEINHVPIHLRKVLFKELYQHVSLEIDEETTILNETHTQAPPEKIPLFGWSRSMNTLILLMEELQDKINVFADQTMLYTFIRVLTSEDLCQEKEKMYLGCKTNLFGYIVERLEFYCTSFTPTTIESSGLFFSKTGNPITKGCLYSSGIKKLNWIKIIDDIFIKYC